MRFLYRARRPIALVALLAAGAIVGVSRTDRLARASPAVSISRAHTAIAAGGGGDPTRSRPLAFSASASALLAAAAVCVALERRRAWNPARSTRRNANRRGPPVATLS